MGNIVKDLIAKKEQLEKEAEAVQKEIDDILAKNKGIENRLFKYQFNPETGTHDIFYWDDPQWIPLFACETVETCVVCFDMIIQNAMKIKMRLEEREKQRINGD